MGALLVLATCPACGSGISEGLGTANPLCGVAVESGPATFLDVTGGTAITPELAKKAAPDHGLWLQVASKCDHGVDLRFSPATIMTVVRTVPTHDGHTIFAKVKPGPVGSKGELDLVQDGKVKVRVKVTI